MTWRQISRSSIGAAGTVLVEFDPNECVYRVTLEEVHREYANNQNDAKRRLAEKLQRIAAELSR